MYKLKDHEVEALHGAFTQTSEEILRIYFAGGCHVNGFPLRPENAFPKITIKHLERHFVCESRQLCHVNLRRANELVVECQSFRPDVLVLQLGHYESGLWVSKRLRRLLRRGKHSPLSGRASDDADQTMSSTQSKWLRSILGAVMDRLLTLAGSPPYSLLALPSDLDRFLGEIQFLAIPIVFVLSPFPCPDMAVKKRRDAMCSSFMELSRKYGFHYLDVTRDLNPALLKLKPSLYADALHLGTEGHERVGALLADAVRDQIHARVVSQPSLELRDARNSHTSPLG